MLREEEKQAYLFIIEMIRQATNDLRKDNERSGYNEIFRK